MNPPPNPFLYRLDRLPRIAAWAAGLFLGGAGGALLLLAPAVPGTLAFLGLLALAAWLVRSAEPIAFSPDELAPPRPSHPPEEAEPLESDSLPEVPAADPLWADIPAGRFRMGSEEWDDEKPVHEVAVSAFRCLRTPVTRRLFRDMMGSDPGWPKGKADERPVNQVSWFEAVAFCNFWSESLRLQTCYRIEGDMVIWDPAADGIRLLMEAEWEYACRAGSAGRWCFGDDESRLRDYAWYGANSGGKPQPVGRKRANAFGLHDMHGNVWEWCWDWYGSYGAEARSDPTGPEKGDRRVLRGGAFYFEPRFLRSTSRYWFVPEYRYQDVGFRCARGPRRQP